MTRPDFCDWFDLIFGSMNKITPKKRSLCDHHRPDFCADRTIRLVQKLYTLLIYQGVGDSMMAMKIISSQHMDLLNANS